MSCIPGLPQHAEHVAAIGDSCVVADGLPAGCAEILAGAADGKADVELRGVLVEVSGNRTYFKVPLAALAGDERRRAFSEMMDTFEHSVAELNERLSAEGIDLGGVLSAEDRGRVADGLVDVLELLASSEAEDAIETRLGDHVSDLDALTTWDRYVIPQALVAYVSGKWSINAGPGVGFSATVLFVLQPWKVVAIDHTLPRPEIVDQWIDPAVAVLGVPNVDFGGGVGGGARFRYGVGTILGPLDRPDDLAGVGLGVSGSLETPFIGGHGKVVAILKNPPLLLGMFGLSHGLSAGAELHGNFQGILDVDEFVEWVQTMLAATGGG